MWCAWIAIAVVVLLATLLLASTLSLARLRRQVAALSPEVRRAILERIDRAGAEDGTPQLLLTTATADAASGSWLSGVPDLPEDVSWPLLGDGAPARFLARIRLLAPPLPAVWHGRVVFLFLDDREELCLRTAPGPSPRSPASEPGSGEKEPVLLGTLRLPRSSERDEHDETPPAYDAKFLLRRLDGLRALLPQDARPERLLPVLLEPRLEDASLMGGAPELIQDEHVATCPRCRTAMRFLFQLGCVPGLRGDGPTAYVYGCDAHPQELEGFVDCS